MMSEDKIAEIEEESARLTDYDYRLKATRMPTVNRVYEITLTKRGEVIKNYGMMEVFRAVVFMQGFLDGLNLGISIPN